MINNLENYALNSLEVLSTALILKYWNCHHFLTKNFLPKVISYQNITTTTLFVSIKQVLSGVLKTNTVEISRSSNPALQFVPWVKLPKCIFENVEMAYHKGDLPQKWP